MICPTGSHKPTNTIVLGFIRALLLKAKVFGADSRVFLTFDLEERLYAAPTWLRVHICVYMFTTCQPRGSHVVPAWFPAWFLCSTWKHTFFTMLQKRFRDGATLA